MGLSSRKTLAGALAAALLLSPALTGTASADTTDSATKRDEIISKIQNYTCAEINSAITEATANDNGTGTAIRVGATLAPAWLLKLLAPQLASTFAGENLEGISEDDTKAIVNAGVAKGQECGRFKGIIGGILQMSGSTGSADLVSSSPGVGSSSLFKFGGSSYSS